MKVGEDVFCDQCNLIIAKGEQMTSARRPGTNGTKPEHFHHYHSRQRGDCYYQYLRDEVTKRKIPVELYLA